MKIGDILTEPLMNYKKIKRSERTAKAKELLRMVELPEEFVDRYPHNMSGGQRQRIALQERFLWNLKFWSVMRRLLLWMFLYRNR